MQTLDQGFEGDDGTAAGGKGELTLFSLAALLLRIAQGLVRCFGPLTQNSSANSWSSSYSMRMSTLISFSRWLKRTESRRSNS